MKKLLGILFMLLGISVLANQENIIEYTHIRNATGILNYGGKKILIDPFFADKDSMEGFPGTYNSEAKNPLIPLPMAKEKIVKGIDAVIVTHTHEDHWDKAAQDTINKNTPIYVQHEKDKELILSQGFKDVKVVGNDTKIGNITLTKTKGQHGTDTMYKVPQVAQVLGEAMGVVFRAENEKTIYIVGDTIWRKSVEDVVTNYKPDIIIMNTGQAEFAQNSDFEEKAIIMGKLDLERMYKFAPKTKIVAVHMDTTNHNTLTRKELRTFIEVKNLDTNRVFVPNDGEKIKF